MLDLYPKLIKNVLNVVIFSIIYENPREVKHFDFISVPGRYIPDEQLGLVTGIHYVSGYTFFVMF